MINARAKGHSYEREIVRRLKGIFPKIKRHLEYQKEEAQGIDLDNSGDFAIQCKIGNTRIPSKIYNYLEGIQSKKKKVIIGRKDRKKDIVIMYFDEWIDILKSYKKLK